MADSFFDALLAHLYAQPEFPKGVKVSLVLNHGLCVRGVIVSPDEFMELNWVTDSDLDEQNRHDMIRKLGLRNSARGSWPREFTYPINEEDPPTNYAHLADVQYLSGGAWVAGSTAKVNKSTVHALGDQW